MWQVTGKVPHRAAYCMHSLSKIKHYYRARLRNDLPISGWIPPMSTYTRVLCYLWNYHGDSLYHYTARRCCLYRAMVQVGLPICCVPHALSCKARGAIPVREPPGDHKWCHIEVPGGVPSVSTQHLGLLHVLESSYRGAPLK